MECLHEDTEGVRIIRLAGRMDIEGNDEIALRFNTLTGTGGPSIIVDLAGVELFGARSNVLSALQRTNVTDFIPTYDTLDEARARVSG